MRQALSELAEDELSYERLQELVRAERRSNKLMPVPNRFWDKLREFLQAVTQEFREQQAKDPWSRKAMLLSDEVKNAKAAAENLWALRERKLAILALARQRDRQRPKGVTADEAQLYEGIREILDRFRTGVFEGTVSAPSATQPQPAPQPAQPPSPASAPHGTPPEQPTPSIQQEPPLTVPPADQDPDPATPASPPVTAVVPSDHSGEDATLTIRALGDIPPFVGPDMQTYLLKEGDLATVPPSIANLLVKRGKAALVEGL